MAMNVELHDCEKESQASYIAPEEVSKFQRKRRRQKQVWNSTSHPHTCGEAGVRVHFYPHFFLHRLILTSA